MPIYALGDVEPSIHPTAYVHPDAVIIGNVEIGEQASVWPNAVLRGDEGRITVGARTSVQDGSVLHVTDVLDTVVGNDCVIGHIVHLEGCVIEDWCLIGNGAVVLHRAVVRSGALVASNAVVTNDMEIPAKALAVGVPAKAKPDAARMEIITDAVEKYLRRQERYRNELRRLD
ncbi:MAG: gamma carbonic anhydrase family protein [Acidimicrobiia bacterium]|nr:gamma carbonic anhydrase family protein [Acidimicrobiia bacterium]